MKTPKLSIIVLLAALFLLSFKYYEDTKGLARVQKLKGKEVYVMCEPLRDYNVVETVGSALAIRTSSCKVDNLVESFMNKAMRQDVDFDAVIVDGDNKATLVKFKN
jgi:hypothetical protein